MVTSESDSLPFFDLSSARQAIAFGMKAALQREVGKEEYGGSGPRYAFSTVHLAATRVNETRLQFGLGARIVLQNREIGAPDIIRTCDLCFRTEGKPTNSRGEYL
jgi:hypothetical protein